jgi:hypothetical protein
LLNLIWKLISDLGGGPFRPPSRLRTPTRRSLFSVNASSKAAGQKRIEAAERQIALDGYLIAPEEDIMPVLIPILWVTGAVVVLGGGWYLIGHTIH